MGDLRGDSKFSRPLLISEQGEPVGTTGTSFHCTRQPNPAEVTTFGALQRGEEFTIPGDPYQDVYRKLGPALARRGDAPIPGWRAEDRVERIEAR